MKLKPDSVGNPDIYLGAKLKRLELENGVFFGRLAPQSMSKRLLEISKILSRKAMMGSMS